MSRLNKVNEELRHQIVSIIQKDIDNPHIGFITITKVEATPDLRIARVYFTTIETDKSFEETLNGLRRSAGFVRKLLGKRMRIKFTPEIKFIYDGINTKANRIDEIIEEIHKEKGTDG